MSSGTVLLIRSSVKPLREYGRDVTACSSVKYGNPGRPTQPRDLLEQFEKHKNMALNQIGTHDGVFHCDEVLACSMLKLLPQYKDATIVRTRDIAKLNKCDIVVDVGHVFDHEKKRYDHHQREFNETMSSLKPGLGHVFQIKLSSAGLIYAYYGEEIIKQLIPKNVSLNSKDLTVIYKKVYKNFIEEIDAIDNGIPIARGELNYKICTNLTARIGHLDPKWNTKEVVDLDEVFKKSMALVSEEFQYTVNYYISTWLPARDYVRSALDKRFEVHNSGQIVEICQSGERVEFTERFPWKEHLFDLEKDMNIGQEIKYLILNINPNSWLVIAVPITYTSFILRKPLPKKWWGAKDEALSKEAGIDGCIFCHSTGFVGGNTTREGALRMAIASLEAEAQ